MFKSNQTLSEGNNGNEHLEHLVLIIIEWQKISSVDGYYSCQILPI